MLRTAILLLLAGSSLALTSGCAGNPATGGSSVVLSSQGREISVGQDMHQQIVEQGAVYDDPELAAYVDRIGQRLVQNSDAPDDSFTFTVIDSPDINAFATPGGFIYVNRGLLAYLDNEAELAGVMAHEIGHVTARHAARQQTASITNQVVATTAYDEFLSTLNWPLGAAIAVVLLIANIVIIASYNRFIERKYAQVFG